MGRIIDSRLDDIFHFRTTDNLPHEVCIPAHRMVRLLLAARAWETLGLFASPQAIADGHFAVAVHKHWHIRFAWAVDGGAYDLCLVRL